MKTLRHSLLPRGIGASCCALFFLLAFLPARAEMQFDVFLGYEGLVREGAWFPVAVEIHNDGPSFDAVLEISPAAAGVPQTRRVQVELPSNTRKRFFIPVFGSTGRMTSWNARLLDSKGKVRAERASIRPKDVAWEAPLLGAVPRSFTTAPALPEMKIPQPESQPRVGRLAADLFPDNPIVLEALSALYLNSEKALELKGPQQAALLAWLHGGGHLVLAVEQPSDVNSLPWLKQLMPGEVKGLSKVQMNGELEAWMRSSSTTTGIKGTSVGRMMPALDLKLLRRYGIRPPSTNQNQFLELEHPFAMFSADAGIASATVSVAQLVPTEGRVMVQVGDTPLVVSAHRGSGKLTVVLFSPEREPFKSWKNRDWFWAKLIDIPETAYVPQNARYGGRGLDGVFGAMIDSRQARKLPVKWLLAILGVYLIVIGPFDHYILKKFNRQMLTWITFPLYVLAFSMLIYFIGYKLRAGETEWNELHVVDILPRGGRAEWRGHTFMSIYSPVNSEYQIAADQMHSTLRAEYGGVWMGNQDTARLRVEQLGKGFDARVFVPVWTSQLLVAEWLQPGVMPVVATPTVGQDDVLELRLQNNLPRAVGPVQIVFRDRVYHAPSLAANGSTNLALAPGSGELLETHVKRLSEEFASKIDNRLRALGDAQRGRIDNLVEASMAASFIAAAAASQNPDGRHFVYSPGFDLQRFSQRGDAVVLIWDADQGAVAPFHKFAAKRTQKNSLLRLVVPVPARDG